jgi:voltage-gated potassium channel
MAGLRVWNNARVDSARLASIPLFAHLGRKQREQLSRWADEIDVAEGKLLAHEGEFAHEFFVIEEGTALAAKGSQQLAELGPGDFFGEIALLETERRTATVSAATPMRLIVLSGPDFRQALREMPEFQAKVRAAIRERLARTPS